MLYLILFLTFVNSVFSVKHEEIVPESVEPYNRGDNKTYVSIIRDEKGNQIYNVCTYAFSELAYLFNSSDLKYIIISDTFLYELAPTLIVYVNNEEVDRLNSLKACKDSLDSMGILGSISESLRILEEEHSTDSKNRFCKSEVEESREYPTTVNKYWEMRNAFCDNRVKVE